MVITSAVADGGESSPLDEASKTVNNFSRLMNQMFDKNSSSPVAVREQQP